VPAKPQFGRFGDNRNGIFAALFLYVGGNQRGEEKRDGIEMKKRWITNLNELMARLANPYRPERHYMRGGKSRKASTQARPQSGSAVDRDRRSGASPQNGA
jgi:hypothetical protein